MNKGFLLMIVKKKRSKISMYVFCIGVFYGIF